MARFAKTVTVYGHFVEAQISTLIQQLGDHDNFYCIIKRLMIAYAVAETTTYVCTVIMVKGCIY